MICTICKLSDQKGHLTGLQMIQSWFKRSRNVNMKIARNLHITTNGVQLFVSLFCLHIVL